MTQRERQASAGLSATAPAPLPLGGAVGHPAPPRPANSPEAASPSLWEDVFRSATPDQRQELLSLASRQGLLYAHQLPPAANGARPLTPAADDPRGLGLLSRLLQGQTGDLKPVRPPPVEVHDRELDERQREAVARALETPDLGLIQGLPGTGKSRVFAEVVTQAAARGERVLLLAPAAAAIDRVLDLVAGRDALCAIRCLAAGERPEDLSPAARAATFPERVRALREQALASAVRAREQAERRCVRLREEEALWPRLEKLAECDRGLCAEAEPLRAQRERIPAEVGTEAERACDPASDPPPSGFGAGLASAAAAHREALAQLQETRTRSDQQRAEKERAATDLAAQVEALRPAADVKRGGRWWSPTWWRATLGGNVVARLAELETQRDAAREELARSEAECAELERRRADAEDAFRAEQRQRGDEEAARRQAEVDAQLAALAARRDAVASEWAEACATLEHEPHRPAAVSADAVRAARALWQSRLKEDEQQCAFAGQWAAYLEESADSLAARLPGLTNLVAATVGGLTADEHFGDPASCGGQFDLLLLDEAEAVTEQELLRLARRARRWVLVGEAPPPAPEGTARTRGQHRPAAALARSQVFHRLWQTLHCDPARLPYAWYREGDRLCCRLRHLAPEQRQFLESERLADWPEVELRILASPRVRPLLAEVIFPHATGLARAKEFIYRELQELPVMASERAPRWAEEADRLVLWLTDVGTADVQTVPLEQGVREVVVAGVDGSGPWHTCRLEFDRQASWDRARAETWVESHLGLRDLGRTARLEVPHRMAPALAAIVSDLLYDGAYRVPAAAEPVAAAVEFVAVPPLSRKDEPSHGGRGRERRRRDDAAVATRSEPRTQQAAFPKAGAGLELDLAATGQSDRLPVELRGALPRRGLVNYREARAIVRRLEELAGETNGSAREAGVAVVALYRAQADLIRRLVRDSAALAASGLRVQVDAPGAFRQREFPVVLVSLTRSHGHRAVSFGEEAGGLALALTRARDCLIVFGDAGTLARRAQWEGVLDHLDESAAAREGEVVGRLLRYLQGAGRHGRAFRLREGEGT